MSYQGISDFRSDTVTRPTPEMRRAMYEAEVGDDVHKDDPTVIRLEEMAAEMLGMEAALFVPSGTMGNTIAMELAVGEGNAVILDRDSHIFNFENANISRLVGGLPLLLDSEKGQIPLRSIQQSLDNPLREHIPRIKAVSLENTHNTCGGVCLDPEYLAEVSRFCRSHELFLHLDGARIFNAAVAQDIQVRQISRYFDSVMFCLSKGLSAPVGSLLLGTREFVREARRVRKYLGGGMRQVGILAAAGIVALEEMPSRLADDHLRARRLGEALADMKGVRINLEDVQTNFVMLELEHLPVGEFLDRLRRNKILALPFSSRTVRMVVHKDIDDRDIQRAIDSIGKIVV